MNVLVAEDDPVTMKKLVTLLEEWGHTIQSAPDGLASLGILKGWRTPGLCIVDWEMPGLSGVELCEVVRLDPLLRDNYLIMVTSRSSREDMLKGFEVGFDDFLSKPFDSEELHARVRAGVRVLSLEKALRERAADAEGNYGSLLESFSAGVVQIDASDIDGASPGLRVLSANRSFLGMVGLTIEDIKGKGLDPLLHPLDRERTTSLVAKMTKGPTLPDNIELTLTRSDGSVLYARTSIIELIGAGTGKRTLLLMFDDITKAKQAHLELMRRTLNYRLEEGRTYLVLEKGHETSLQALKDLLGIGYHATVLSRRDESQFRKMAQGSYRFHWISSADVPGTIPPDPGVLLELVNGLPPKEVVYTDRLDYIMSKSGFVTLLDLVQRIREQALLKGHIAILGADPATFNDREKALLLNECEIMEPYYRSNISEDLFKVLKVVQRRNVLHLDASLTSIEEELGLSRPTSRKRVRQLLEFEFLVEVLKGKEKTYLLTDKGRHVVE